MPKPTKYPVVEESDSEPDREDPPQTQEDVDIDYKELKSGGNSTASSTANSNKRKRGRKDGDDPEEDARDMLSCNHYHLFAKRRREQLKKAGKSEKEIKATLKSEWADNTELHEQYKEEYKQVVEQIHKDFPHLTPRPRATRSNKQSTSSTSTRAITTTNSTTSSSNGGKKQRKQRDGPKICTTDFAYPPKLENALFAWNAPKRDGKSVTGKEKKDLYDQLPQEIKEECEQKVKRLRQERKDKIKQYDQEDKDYLGRLGIEVN